MPFDQSRSVAFSETARAKDVIQQDVDQRHTRPGTNPEREALILMSAFYGVSLNILAGANTGAVAVATTDHQLDRIFR